MNPVARRLIAGWVIAELVMAGIFLGVLPALGLLPWIRMNGVIWFGIILGVVLLVVYVIGSALGMTAGAGGARTAGGGDAYDSKGAGKR